MIIDAKNKILGRIATLAAKTALLGETVHILNCEEAVITGKKQSVLAHYQKRRERGYTRGPFITRLPDRFVKRTIRGMLSYKKPKGANALKKIRCYQGMPDKFKDQKTFDMPKSDISKLPNFQYVKVGELCKFLGGKQ